MDKLLADLVAIKTRAEAEDFSYHTDYDEISRVRASRQWIDAYVRRAEAERAEATDRDAYVERLRALVDEVTEAGDYAQKPSASYSVTHLLDNLE